MYPMNIAVNVDTINIKTRILCFWMNDSSVSWLALLRFFRFLLCWEARDVSAELLGPSDMSFSNLSASSHANFSSCSRFFLSLVTSLAGFFDLRMRHSWSHSIFALPPLSLQRISFFLRLQWQYILHFFLHNDSSPHFPEWQVRKHLCPHDNSFGHWSLQHPRDSLSFSERGLIHFSHSTYNCVSSQWHLMRINCKQVSHGSSWQARWHGWLHPSGRGRVHPNSHFRQFAPQSISLGAFFTLWQDLSQKWLPHGNLLPQLRPHELGLALKHGQSVVSCPPRHVTETGTVQSGQSSAFSSMSGLPDFCNSQGVAAAFLAGVSSTFTFTLSWHGDMQLCPHFNDLSHTCLHPGQGPKWQECVTLARWWQSVGALHLFLHLGGLVERSIPQGTRNLECPQ